MLISYRRFAIGLGLAICAQSAAATETITYKYDALGRLVQVSRSGSSNNGVTAKYTYDAADNRTNVTVTRPIFVVVPLNGYTVIPIPAR